ncbi:hypothetical protein HNO89_002234 [Sporosarcina luteola]|nr:hypothetical protein [Sporosarcina luteola]
MNPTTFQFLQQLKQYKTVLPCKPFVSERPGSCRGCAWCTYRFTSHFTEEEEYPCKRKMKK